MDEYSLSDRIRFFFKTRIRIRNPGYQERKMFELTDRWSRTILVSRLFVGTNHAKSNTSHIAGNTGNKMFSFKDETAAAGGKKK